MLSLRARTERLWANYFREPSHWCDHRKNKKNPRAPDFTDTLTQESLWIDGWYTPDWVKGKLLSEAAQGTVGEGESREENDSVDEREKRDAMHAPISSENNILIPHPCPDNFGFVLQKPDFECSNQNGGSKRGVQFHGSMGYCGLKSSHGGDIFFTNLADMGCSHHTQGSLDHVEHPSWYSIIRGYLKLEMYEQALVLYDRMKMHRDVQLNARMSVAILQACAKLKDLETGREMHARIVKCGMQEENIFIGSVLIYLYGMSGSHAEAENVFDKFFLQDVVMWTALIAGYTCYGYYRKALECLKQMQSKGVSPNIATIVSILKACDIGCTLMEIEEIVGVVERDSFLAKESILGTALVGMHARSGSFVMAQQVFDTLPFQNTATWNALLSGFTEHRKSEEALRCFERMQREGFPGNVVTFTCGLKSCGELRAVNKGKEMHAEINAMGFLETDVPVGNALVNMYCKCGMLELAKSTFSKLKVRDAISWTSLIAGFTECGHGKEAVKYYEQMQLENVVPNAVTYICSLRACSNIGAIERGFEIHAETERMGLSETNVSVGNALIDMYAKVGLIFRAWQVFHKLSDHDNVSWNTLITGYAQLGQVENVFQTFHSMRLDGKLPDCVTFIVILNACSRSCLYNRSQTYLELMSHNYGIIPGIKHYTCVVDLLGRAGEIGQAVEMIKEAPEISNMITWRAILTACRYWGNVELGISAFGHVNKMAEHV